MYAGSSGCYGMVIYNTDIKGNNAVYGYYKGSEMCFETGTAEEMKDLKRQQEKELDVEKSSITKSMVIFFFVFLAFVVFGFVALPLRIAFAIAVFCFLSYMPLLVITAANTEMYADPELKASFRRFHGCEHAIVDLLTKGKDQTMEELRRARIYDTECGTAYSGYVVALALELALLIVFWPGLLKAIGLLFATVVLLLVMIIFPKINPFTLIQHPVVLPPTEREYELGVEIMKKMKEL